MALWKYAEEIGRHYFGATSDPTANGLEFILRRISDQIEIGDASFAQDTGMQRCLDTMISNNAGRPLTLDAMGIDIAALHKNPKCRSGYAGVYANGKGYRAEGHDGSGKPVHIGTFKSPEEAAWKRRVWYLTNKLPYGELEDELMRQRNEFPMYARLPLAAQIDAARQHLMRVDKTHLVFGPGTSTIEPPLPDLAPEATKLSPPTGKLPTREEILDRARRSEFSIVNQEAIQALGFEDEDLPPSLANDNWKPGKP